MSSGPPRPPSRLASSPIGALAGAALCVVLFWLLFLEHGLDLQRLRGPTDPYLRPVDALVLLLAGATGLPAAWFASRAVQSFRDPVPEGERSARWIIGLLSLVAAGLSVLFAHYITGYVWLTDDEQVYLLQAKALLEGSFSLSPPGPDFLRSNPFVLSIDTPGGPRWAGVYQVGQPALLALGTMIGLPRLTQFLAVGAIVYQTGGLARDILGVRASVVAATLAATSPMLIGIGATLHTAIPTCLMVIVAARLALRARRDERGALIALGLAMGLTVLMRPVEGLVTLLVGSLVAFARPRPERASAPRELTRLGRVAVGGAVPAVLFVSVNLHVTGKPFLMPYDLLRKTWGPIFGFKMDALFAIHGAGHGIPLALVQASTVAFLLSFWAFGSPVPWMLAWEGLARPRASRAMWTLLGAALVGFAMYAAAPFGSVIDFGSYYHLWMVPLGSVLAAHWATTARDLDRPAPLNRLIAAVAVGWFTFIPVQIGRLYRTAESIHAPLRVAEAAAAGEKTIVLYAGLHPLGYYTSAVLQGPVALDPADPILWARVRTTDAAVAAAEHYRDRKRIVLQWQDGWVATPYTDPRIKPPGPVMGLPPWRAAP